MRIRLEVAPQAEDYVRVTLTSDGTVVSGIGSDYVAIITHATAQNTGTEAATVEIKKGTETIWRKSVAAGGQEELDTPKIVLLDSDVTATVPSGVTLVVETIVLPAKALIELKI